MVFKRIISHKQNFRFYCEEDVFVEMYKCIEYKRTESFIKVTRTKNTQNEGEIHLHVLTVFIIDCLAVFFFMKNPT